MARPIAPSVTTARRIASRRVWEPLLTGTLLGYSDITCGTANLVHCKLAAKQYLADNGLIAKLSGRIMHKTIDLYGFSEQLSLFCRIHRDSASLVCLTVRWNSCELEK